MSLHNAHNILKTSPTQLPSKNRNDESERNAETGVVTNMLQNRVLNNLLLNYDWDKINLNDLMSKSNHDTPPPNMLTIDRRLITRIPVNYRRNLVTASSDTIRKVTLSTIRRTLFPETPNVLHEIRFDADGDAFYDVSDYFYSRPSFGLITKSPRTVDSLKRNRPMAPMVGELDEIVPVPAALDKDIHERYYHKLNKLRSFSSFK